MQENILKTDVYLKNIYNFADDGVESPRSRGVDGGDLPNARNISNNVHIGKEYEDEIRSPDITLHTFQMGQFLDHDIIATPIQTGEICSLRHNVCLLHIIITF